MKPVDAWLEEYASSHCNRTNKLVHWLCVPLIVLSLVGMLWSLPVPEVFSDASPALNWGTIFLMAAVVYYFIMSISLAVGVLPFIVIVTLIVAWIDRLEVPLWLVSSCLFTFAWLGQFVGHWIEGRRPAFLKDLQFLMIGPLWLLASVYRRLGIPY
jgi:uncharacterized membrane protein YGL010W